MLIKVIAQKNQTVGKVFGQTNRPDITVNLREVVFDACFILRIFFYVLQTVN